MARTVEIDLNVDVENLMGEPVKTQEVIKQNCTLSDDNNGCSPGGEQLKDFQSIVFLGKEVVWKGIVVNAPGPGNYRVDIENIVFKGGTDILESIGSFEEPVTFQKKVRATVKKDPKYNNALYVYAIEAKVCKGNDCAYITIDPKLQANT